MVKIATIYAFFRYEAEGVNEDVNLARSTKNSVRLRKRMVLAIF